MTGIRSAIHRLYVRLGERLAPGRILCRAGIHDTTETCRLNLCTGERTLVWLCRRPSCPVVELASVPMRGPLVTRSKISAVPSPADPPPISPEAPRAPAGGDTPGTFSGGGR